MNDKKITCLACGVFRMELDALMRQGRLDCDLIALDSMLHMKPANLEQKMVRVIAARQDDKFLILYGDCHPRMHEMQEGENATKVSGINCCEILLGRDIYRKLQKEQAFIFLPEWTLRWHDVFTRELGFEKPDVAQAFMRDHCKRLVYVDTGVIPVPDATLGEISGFFNMPVEVLRTSLDFLLQGITIALRKFMGTD
ncbi:MAG: DUF1638 domain-containing protein [Desulfuromonadales bacterium]|nr:DUF1638 domain-containing protein [Desulfuromonadales bacterium]